MRVNPAVVMVVLAALVCIATQGVAANAGHSVHPGAAVSAGGDAVAGGAGGPTSNADLRWMLVTHSKQKRNVKQLGEVMKCATGCNPVAYKGYGCYCGLGGSGTAVDGIDQCCAEHDNCYSLSSCLLWQNYFATYHWYCRRGVPFCYDKGGGSACSSQKCECDRRFARCLRRYPCPRSRPVCESAPLRHWQNFFLPGFLS